MNRSAGGGEVGIVGDPVRESRSLLLERLCCEVNSKCGNLRAASRLLPGLSTREFDEVLLLMAEVALRLTKSLEEHRRAHRQDGGG